MIRRPPRSTRTDTLFPYTTLFRSLRIANARLRSPQQAKQMPFIAAAHIRRNSAHGVAGAVIARQRRTGLVRSSAGVQMATLWLRPNVRHEESPSRRQARRKIGREHV